MTNKTDKLHERMTKLEDTMVELLATIDLLNDKTDIVEQ